GQSWGVNESMAYRIIRRIEDILVNKRAFSLPGKKKLSSCDYQVKVVVVDVTESPIERPKKTKTVLQWPEEKAYTKISSCGSSKHGPLRLPD
ncbi:MAG TPA: hypothetical protein VIQ31_08715, partial [Phormidium sp.]